MSKMHYFSNKFSKIAKRSGLAPEPSTFKLIMTKSNLKNSYDVITVTSHFPQFGPRIQTSGYASAKKKSGQAEKMGICSHQMLRFATGEKGSLKPPALGNFSIKIPHLGV